MLLRWTDPKTQIVTEVPGLRLDSARMRDLAALQREMGWKLAKINEVAELEGVGMALMIYLSFRATGRLITYARAEELLDEVDPVPEPGDIPEPEEATEDPQSAPTDSARGDELPAVAAPQTASLP